MAKIHTHYDNLKVARLAPQEVIRAAYKALSQKYHPDKNPGDEKAARIMAIINSAYGTLADPQRRREHDEWIAAEEWEVEWLESTRQEEVRAPGRSGPGAGPGPAAAAARNAERERERERDAEPEPAGPAARRYWPWYCGLAACLALGWAGGALVSAPELVPPALASAWSRPAAAGPAGSAAAAAGLDGGHLDSWSAASVPAPAQLEPVGRGAAPAGPPFHVAAVVEVVLPAAPVECGAIGGQTRLTPNGDPWPARSGLLEGYPAGNQGEALQLTLDNGANALPLFVRLYDVERRSNVRFVYVLPHDKLTLDRLALGKYEVRYQSVDVAGTGRDGCRSTAPAPAPAS